MNKKLTIIIDNAPSSHKEGILENIEKSSDLIIIHIPSVSDSVHPSEYSLRNSSFEDRRFRINHENNNSKINKYLDDLCINNINNKGYESIVVLYSFLDLRRLFIVQYLSNILLKTIKNVELIPHLEPIRINDFFVIPRLIKTSISLIFQKKILKVRTLYITSNLNSFIYKIFFKNIYKLPYQESKSYRLNYIAKQRRDSLNIFNILFIGQFIHRKDPLTLLYAFKRLKFRAHLNLVGSGPLLKRCKKIVSKEIKDKMLTCEFHGHVNHSQILELLKTNHVLVLPSKFDGYGFVVSEAIDCNTYSIVSSEVGSKDLLKEGSIGSIFRVGSISQLVNQLSLHFIRSGLPNA